jgi:hypothetical protein
LIVRRVLFPALVLALGLAWAPRVEAQSFGPLTGVRVLDPDGRLFGVYLNGSDNAVNLLGQLRLSVYPGVDFGFQGGLARLDVADRNRTGLDLGADVRWGIGGQRSGLLQLAVGGGFKVEVASDYTVISGGPLLGVGTTFGVGGNSRIEPYAYGGISVASADIDDDKRTDWSFPLKVGATFDMSGALMLVPELEFRFDDQLRDDIALTLGINFPF